MQVIEGLGGPPYSFYGGSAFEPRELPPVGALWLPGHRLAAKMPGDEGTRFFANPAFRWREQSGRSREYPAWDDPGYPYWIDPVRGPDGEYGEDLTRRIYAQPIQARVPTGVVPRTEEAGMHYVIRGKMYPGDVGPSVSGLRACAQCGPLGQVRSDPASQGIIFVSALAAIALSMYGLIVWGK